MQLENSLTGVRETAFLWMLCNRGHANMRWCSSVGLVGTIFENMGWDPEIKYRVLGRKVIVENDEVIVFSLTDSFMIWLGDRS